MDDKTCNFLRQRVWAVVGASTNPEKFGYKIYQLLRRYGFTVYPVNPKESSIDGQPCYATLAELPVTPDAVDVVVPPAVAVEVAKECAQLGIKLVWFQPGVADQAVIATAQSLGLDFIHDNCVMVESSKLFLLGKKVWAVACDDTKVGGQLADFLTARGHTTYVVTPDARPGEGFAALEALPMKPEAVAIAAQGYAERVITDCARLGIRGVWLEGNFSTNELVQLAVAKGLTVVHHASVTGEYQQVMACREHSPVP